MKRNEQDPSSTTRPIKIILPSTQKNKKKNPNNSSSNEPTINKTYIIHPKKIILTKSNKDSKETSLTKIYLPKKNKTNNTKLFQGVKQKKTKSN